MKLPHILKCMITENNKGIFYFKNAECYGNPFNGPWIEKIDNGAIRKYEHREMPVSGYSSTAKSTIQQNQHCIMSPELRSQVNKTIDMVVKYSKITFRYSIRSSSAAHDPRHV